MIHRLCIRLSAQSPAEEKRKLEEEIAEHQAQLKELEKKYCNCNARLMFEGLTASLQ